VRLAAIAPIDVYSVPGNHGRLTRKPESKGIAINSFDTLICQVVEMMLAMATTKHKVKFYYPLSGDALFRVYGWTFVAAHGDRVGSKGGQGFLGAIATIVRGMHRVHAYYAGQGVTIDYVMVGHLHTTAYVPTLGFSNGSLVGPSEYSRDLRARPEQAKQNYIVVHSERGVIEFRDIKVGASAEGSIYQARNQS